MFPDGLSVSYDYGKTYVVEFPFNRPAQKQSTAYYRTELQTRSGSVQKRKNVLKFQKFQKNLCVIIPFSLTAQPAGSRISDFSKHTFQENVSFEYSEKVGSLPEKSQ